LSINVIGGEIPLNVLPKEAMASATGTVAELGQNIQMQPFGSEVQLFLDSQVRALLEQLTQILIEQNIGMEQLPPQVAEQAKDALHQPFQADAFANGLSTLVRGQKAAADVLVSMAGNLEAAVLFKQEFPSGIPTDVKKVLQSFKQQMSDMDPLITEKYITDVAGQLTSAKKTQTEAPFLLRQAADQLQKTYAADVSQGRQNIPASIPQVAEELINEFGKQLMRSGPSPEKEELMAGLKEIVILMNETVEIDGGQKAAPEFNKEIAQNIRQEHTEEEAKLISAGDNGKLQPKPPVKADADVIVQSVLIPKEEEPAFSGNNKLLNQPITMEDVEQALDTIVKQFDMQLIAKNPMAEKAVAAAKLRQMAGLLTQDLPQGPVVEKTLEFVKVFLPKPIHQAIRTHMPEIEKIWVTEKLETIQAWANLSSEQLKESGQQLRQLAAGISKFSERPAQMEGQQNGMTLLIPFFFSPDSKPYPTYIHIYKDRQQQNAYEDGGSPEVWLRMCMATENLGIVDLMFHLYGQNQLSIKVKFSDAAPAEKFKETVPDIRERLETSNFVLSDISVVSLALGE